MKNLSAAKGISRGEINLQWDPADNAVSYIIEIASVRIHNNIKWKILDIISDSRYTVRDLKSKRNYYFRIATADKNGRKQTGVGIEMEAP